MKYLFLMVLALFICNSNLGYGQNPEWVNFTNGNTINSVAEEGNYIWAGTNGGLLRINKFTSEKLFFNRTNSGLPENTVLSIAIDNSGNKWIGTFSCGLAKYDGTNWTVYNYTNSGLPSNSVTSLAIDNSGNKWIVTDSGLAKYNGTTWTVYLRTNSGLPNTVVRTIAIDNSENKWIGTNSGLAKYNGTTWTWYGTANKRIA